jgi:hypothetical protein
VSVHNGKWVEGRWWVGVGGWVGKSGLQEWGVLTFAIGVWSIVTEVASPATRPIIVLSPTPNTTPTAEPSRQNLIPSREQSKRTELIVEVRWEENRE